MSKNKATPGPWRLNVYDDGAFTLHAQMGGDCPTALVCSRNELPKKWASEGIANAHLIAAAPDLLQACKVAFVALAAPEWGDAQDQIRAAIAKAEGTP